MIVENKLLRKFLSFSIGTWVGVLISLVSIPIIMRMTSPEELGKASMYEIFINLFGVLAIFGVDQAYVRFFYEESQDKRKYLLRNSLKLPLLFSVIISLTVLLFQKKILLYLFGESSIFLSIILVLGIFHVVLNRFSFLAIRMQQKGKTYSMMKVSLKIVSFAGTVLFLKIFNGSYKGIVLGNLISLIIITVLSIIIEKKEWLFFEKENNLRHSQKDIIKFGSQIAITALIAWIFKSTDKIFIKNYSTIYELGLYAGAFRIVGLLSIIQVSFSTFWTPISYESFEKNPEEKDIYKKFFFIISTAMLSVAILSIAFRSILIFLLGKKFESAILIMPFLIFIPIMRTISEITVVGISFYKKLYCHTIIALVATLINIIGNYLLVPTYGARGAALASAIAYIVFFQARTYYSNKFYPVDYNLKKFYGQLTLTFIFASYASFINNVYLDILFGTVLIIVIVTINFKEVKKLFLKGEN